MVKKKKNSGYSLDQKLIKEIIEYQKHLRTQYKDPNKILLESIKYFKSKKKMKQKTLFD
jgi:hypothetical protein